MAANLVNLEAVSEAYGTTTVLADVSLGVASGDRIGVVGRNGSGKTTLLRLITGDEVADAGRVTRTGGLHIATVTQRGELPADATVREVVVGDAPAHEWAGDAGIREILAGLGLAAVGLDVTVGRLSGGERRRVALAAALVERADLLVLDEPTNHLDVEGITWLASYLIGRRGALLVVTHDRWFLDEVCERTWEVVDGSVQQYGGGYAAYVLARAERARRAGAAEVRRQNLLRKELAWLRHGAPARTSKPRFRLDAAEALIADEPPPRSSVELRALSSRRLGRSVYDLESVTVRAGGRVLLDDVSWHVGPGDRIGVIGVNGSGKTHLLRLLAGELAPFSGVVSIGATVRAGYLPQDVTPLPSDLRVLDAVQQVRAVAVLGKAELSASQLAERFGFANNRQWTPVADLSGGERRRLQLMRLLLEEPNVLLLDEPTNDLDTDTLAALEDLLDAWVGTLVVVSHDRYLIERVCDSTVALLGDGSLAALPGGVEEYLARRREPAPGGRARTGDTARTGGARRAPTARTGRAPGALTARAGAEPGTPTARAGAEPGAPTASAGAEPRGPAARTRKADPRVARRELTRLERQVATLERRESALHEQLAQHATDHTRVIALEAELRAVVAARVAAEDAWLAAAAGD